MRVAVLGDTHFGVRNDNQAFHDYYEKFYANVFFPYMEKHKISTVIQLGDLFDRRKYVNFYTLKRSREYFFDKLAEANIDMHMFVGNHDTYFKNTNEVNSPELLLKDYYESIKVYSEPTDVELPDGTLVTMLPWICSDNYERCMTHVRDTKSQIMFGHLELSGFEMHRGAVNDHGMDAKLFDKFDLVMSGHYHHKSFRGNIHYLGTPYEMTWSDYNDPRGFHIFDTETRELEFIQNPHTMFQKWFYNDTNWVDQNEMNALDFGNAKDAFVKVVVKSKTNPYWFDMYVERLEKAGALDIQVVDDNLNLQLEDDEDIVDEAEDTLTILKNYASMINSTVDNNELNKFLSELYSEALAVE